MMLNGQPLPSKEEVEQELWRTKKWETFRRILKNTILSLIVAAAIAVLIFTIFFPTHRITSDSMEPTLSRDQLVVCCNWGEPQYGDIIAFYYNNVILVKRIIGKAGDVINIDGEGNVTRNDVPLDEPYVRSLALGECDIKLPFVVPEKQYFVIGDNREISIDSRSTLIGCVVDEKVIGRVVFRIWKLKDFGLVN